MKTYRIHRSNIHSNRSGQYYAVVDTPDGRLNVHFDANMRVISTAFVSLDAFGDEEHDDSYQYILVNIEVI